MYLQIAGTAISSPVSPSQYFDALYHLKNYIQDNKDELMLSPQHLAILDMLCGCIPKEFYMAQCKTVFTLLHNVVHCFDNEKPAHSRLRRCNVILGMKCTGKTFLTKTLMTAIAEQYPDSITVFLDGLTFREK
jgi:hypothetical protein